MKSFAIVLSILFVCLKISSALGAEDQKDGLVASVRVEGQTALVEWRFERALPAPLQRLSASFNGRALSVGQSVSYPRAEDKSALILLVDITGSDQRRRAIYRAKARLLRLYDFLRPHQVVAFGVIDRQLKLAVTNSGSPNPLAAMEAVGQTDNQPLLGESLLLSIEALGEQPASRRAAFVFTDGFSETRIDAQAIIDLARKNEVGLNFIVEPSERPSDLASLRRIAEETGGVYAEGDDIARLLQAPFAFTDSGAYAEVELGNVFHYPWEAGRDLVVTFRYGERALELDVPIAARQATARESLTYLWNGFGREVAVLAAGAGWAIALVGMAVGGSYRRRARKAREREAAMRRAADETSQASSGRNDIDATPIAAAPPPSSVVETGERSDPVDASPPASADAAPPPDPPPAAPTGLLTLRLHRPDGKGHIDFPLEGGEISIGRGDDNDVVLKHPSVSIRHALLIPLPRNAYAIQNLSRTNPTRIDGQSIIHQELIGQEKVEFGEINAEILRRELAASPETFA